MNTGSLVDFPGADIRVLQSVCDWTHYENHRLGKKLNAQGFNDFKQRNTLFLFQH